MSTPHWSYDETAAKVQRRHNRNKERRWRAEFKGKHVPTNREKAITSIMREYDCNHSQAERVLDLITEK